jgi:hypothetical protein
LMARHTARHAPLLAARGSAGWWAWIGHLSRRSQQGIWMHPLFNRRTREPVLRCAWVGCARRNVRVRRARGALVHVLNLEVSPDVHRRSRASVRAAHFRARV